MNSQLIAKDIENDTGYPVSLTEKRIQGIFSSEYGIVLSMDNLELRVVRIGVCNVGLTYKVMESMKKSIEKSNNKTLYGSGVNVSINTCYGTSALKTGRLTNSTKPVKLPKNDKSVSFDALVMECDNLLDIETKITTTYEKWKTDKIYTKVKTKKLINKAWEPTSKEIKAVNDETIGIIATIILCIKSYFHHVKQKQYCDDEYEIVTELVKNKTIHADMSDDELKLCFLKESYVTTIDNLNQKLELIQTRIKDQRDSHLNDKAQVKDNSDLFSNSNDVIDKIDKSIKKLDLSYDKLQDKKSDINKTLNKYIGENGYIDQKEKEIKKLKLAQELSDRISKNLHQSLEITYSVDVLVDTIIPGIKQLLSFRIPELIDSIDFEHDKESIFLNEKSSMIAD